MRPISRPAIVPTFVSYRRDDSRDFTVRLVAALVDRLQLAASDETKTEPLGVSGTLEAPPLGDEAHLHDRAALPNWYVFVDSEDIRAGCDFRTEIAAALTRCAALIVVVGEQFLTLERDGKRRLEYADDWVRLEIEHALTRQLPVFVVRVEGTPSLRAEGLPEGLLREKLPHVQSLSVRSARRAQFDHDVGILIEEMAKVGVVTEVPAAPAAPPRLLSARRVVAGGMIALALGACVFLLIHWRKQAAPNPDQRSLALNAGLYVGAASYVAFTSEEGKKPPRAEVTAALGEACAPSVPFLKQLGLPLDVCEKFTTIGGGTATEPPATLREAIQERCGAGTARAFRTGLSFGVLSAAAGGAQEAYSSIYPQFRMVLALDELPIGLGELPLQAPPQESLPARLDSMMAKLDQHWHSQLGPCRYRYDDKLRSAAFKVGLYLGVVLTGRVYTRVSNTGDEEQTETELIRDCKERIGPDVEALMKGGAQEASPIGCELLEQAIQHAVANTGAQSVASLRIEAMRKALRQASARFEQDHAAKVSDAFELGALLGEASIHAEVTTTGPEADLEGPLKIYDYLYPRLNLKLEWTSLRTRFPTREQLGGTPAEQAQGWREANQRVRTALKQRW